MFPIRRFYTAPSKHAETSSHNQPGSLSSGLGSRLGGLAGSTYERVGEEHHPPPNQHHHHQPPSVEHHRPLSTEPEDTEDDEANAEAAAAAMGALGPDGLPIVPFR